MMVFPVADRPGLVATAVLFVLVVLAEDGATVEDTAFAACATDAAVAPDAGSTIWVAVVVSAGVIGASDDEVGVPDAFATAAFGPTLPPAAMVAVCAASRLLAVVAAAAI